MKKLSYLLSLLVVLGIAFSSCEEEVEPNAPTISVSPTETSVNAGDTAVFSVQVSSNSELLTLVWSVTKGSLSAGNGSYVFESGVHSESVDVNIAVGADLENDDVLDVSFTISDQDLTADATAKINVVVEGTPFATEITNGEIFHLWGQGLGAWDLITNQGRSMSNDVDADKDMANTTVASGDVFVHGWEANNNTIFVKANSYDYANATKEDAAVAFAAGTSGSEISDVVVDDIYIAKLRGGSDYAVIKITQVDDTTVSKSGTGVIRFTYKK